MVNRYCRDIGVEWIARTPPKRQVEGSNPSEPASILSLYSSPSCNGVLIKAELSVIEEKRQHQQSQTDQQLQQDVAEMSQTMNRQGKVPLQGSVCYLHNQE
jgi:hypothetical protein